MEKALVNLLSTEDDDDVKTAICEAVQVMSNNPASTDCFRELGIDSAFVFNPCNVDTQSQHMDSSVAGAIPEVIKLLKSKNVGLREAATCALCGVINSSKPNAL